MATTRKVCTYDCVYCQYGAEGSEPPGAASLPGLPPVDEVIEELEEYLVDAARRGRAIDHITFAGNGEPTLHPGFPQMIDAAIELRDTIAPRSRIAILTNGSMLSRPPIARAVALVDRPIVKLDAGTEEAWRRVNRPARSLSWDDHLDALRGLPRIELQAMRVDGIEGLGEPREVEAWLDLVADLAPLRVQLYSLDRPAAERHVRPVAPVELEDLAQRLLRRDVSGVSVY